MTDILEIVQFKTKTHVAFCNKVAKFRKALDFRNFIPEK